MVYVKQHVRTSSKGKMTEVRPHTRKAGFTIFGVGGLKWLPSFPYDGTSNFVYKKHHFIRIVRREPESGNKLEFGFELSNDLEGKRSPVYKSELNYKTGATALKEAKDMIDWSIEMHKRDD